jgi:hypothetical protein
MTLPVGAPRRPGDCQPVGRQGGWIDGGFHLVDRGAGQTTDETPFRPFSFGTACAARTREVAKRLVSGDRVFENRKAELGARATAPTWKSSPRMG